MKIKLSFWEISNDERKSPAMVVSVSYYNTND